MNFDGLCSYKFSSNFRRMPDFEILEITKVISALPKGMGGRLLTNNLRHRAAELISIKPARTSPIRRNQNAVLVHVALFN